MDTLSGSFGARFALAALVVGLALAAFFAGVSYFRRRTDGRLGGSLFGGRLQGLGALGMRQTRGNRARIQVLESVAVDARRRLLLIRRDDVEHLVLIGGPADLVVESGIDGAYEQAADETPDQRSRAETYSYDDDLTDYEDDAPPAESRFDEPRAEDEADLEPETEFLEGIRPVRPTLSREAKPIAIASRPQPRLYGEWQDDEFEDADLIEQLELDAAADIRRTEPAPGTIRPVTLSRPERSLAPPQPQISAEEAAIARELEAARRRAGTASPRPPQQPQAPLRPTGAFDQAMASEMEQQLEAAKRQAQGTPRPVVQQQRRDPLQTSGTATSPDQRSLEAELSQLFGEDAPRRE